MPASLACITCAAALATLKLPTRLTITVVWNCDSGIGPSLPSTRPAPRMPAQLIAASRPPRKSLAAVTLATTPASSLTSARKYRALPSPSLATAAAPFSSLTSNRATLAPLATRCWATAKPRPETPPVTMARVLASCMGGPVMRRKERDFTRLGRGGAGRAGWTGWDARPSMDRRQIQRQQSAVPENRIALSGIAPDLAQLVLGLECREESRPALSAVRCRGCSRIVVGDRVRRATCGGEDERKRDG